MEGDVTQVILLVQDNVRKRNLLIFEPKEIGEGQNENRIASRGNFSGGYSLYF